MKIEDKIQEANNRFNTALGVNSVTARMLSTTNKRFQKYVMFEQFELSLEDQLAWIYETYFHTSYITKVEYKIGNQFHINTRNSVYVFEILDVEYLSWFEEGVLFEMSSDEVEMYENYLRGM